jgi:hypothetical protein
MLYHYQTSTQVHEVFYNISPSYDFDSLSYVEVNVTKRPVEWPAVVKEKQWGI